MNLANNFKKYALVILLCSSNVVMAQERAAGGTADLQMTWSALSNIAKAAQAKADAVNSRVDQVVVCGAKGMVYSPGAAGVDGQGCVKPMNTVNTTNYDNVVNCSNSGLVYQASTNSCIMAQAKSSVPSCRMQVRNSTSTGTGVTQSPCASDTVPFITRESGSGGGSDNNNSWNRTDYDCYAVVCQ